MDQEFLHTEVTCEYCNNEIKIGQRYWNIPECEECRDDPLREFYINICIQCYKDHKERLNDGLL